MNMTEIQFAWNVANNYFKTHTDTNDYKTATAFCMVKNSVYVGSTTASISLWRTAI